MTTKEIETPVCPMNAPTLAGKKLALISILRAGNGLLDGVLELIPSARVGFVAFAQPYAIPKKDEMAAFPGGEKTRCFSYLADELGSPRRLAAWP